MEWYLKKAGGEIFGPAPTAALRQWAANGRIAPDDQVSTDQETWMPAVDLPDLGLDWMVELGPDKLYGPFHLLALGDLIREGSVPAAAPIIHRVTGERHILHEALLLVVLEQNTRLAATAQELRLSLESAQAELESIRLTPVLEPVNITPIAAVEEPATVAVEEPLTVMTPAVNVEPPAPVVAAPVETPPAPAVPPPAPAPAPATDTIAPVSAPVPAPAAEAAAPVSAPTPVLAPPAPAVAPAAPTEAEVPPPPPPSRNAEWKDMASKRDHFEKEMHRWKRLYADLQASSTKHEQGLTERVEHLRREELAARTQLEQSQISLQKLQKTIKQISDVTVFPTAGDAAAAQRAAVLDAYNELSRRCDALMDQLNAKSGELEGLEQSQQRIKEEADVRVQAVEVNMRREREDADRARKRALLLEEDHLQLLRSFRDLNDRYIRMRQGTGHVSTAENPWPPPSETVPKADLPEL